LLNFVASQLKGNYMTCVEGVFDKCSVWEVSNMLTCYSMQCHCFLVVLFYLMVGCWESILNSTMAAVVASVCTRKDPNSYYSIAFLCSYYLIIDVCFLSFLLTSVFFQQVLVSWPLADTLNFQTCLLTNEVIYTII